LSEPELKKVNLNVKVSINQEAEEAKVHEVPILELQENSTFMGFPSKKSKIMVPKFYEDFWKIAEKLHENRAVTRMLIIGTHGMGSQSWDGISFIC